MLERKYFARQGQRYVQVSPGARYESEIQRLVERNIPALFPDYLGLLMDPLFSTPAGDVQPDLVLVRSDGTGWGLVEVELEGHSFRGHVLPQLSKLTQAESFPKLVLEFIERLPSQSISEELLRTALTYRPMVFLVIHGSSLRHEAKLTKLGVEVRDVDVLEAPDKPNEYILVVTDRTIRRRPLPTEAIRSSSPMSSNIWTLTDLSVKSIVTSENKVEIEILGTRAFWSVSDAPDGLLLRQPSGLSNPESDVDSILRASVFIDDEHEVLYLEPSRSDT